MIDDFVDRVVGLLNDRTHGVLITVLQLMTCVLVTDMEYHGEGGGGDEGGDNTATVAVVATTTTAATTAPQRHRTTVMDCLRDPDISIRQHALGLIYYLIHCDNVEALTAELLNYFVQSPREQRGDMCTRILRVVNWYSPDDWWRVNTLITLLTITG
jgi:hypothetical protein